MNNTQNASSFGPMQKGSYLDSIRTLVITLAFLVLGTGLVIYQGTRTSTLTGQNLQPSVPSPTVATNVSTVRALVNSNSEATLVYGIWEEGKSIIKTLNADGSNHTTLAKLPSNIKDVNVISESELLYIAETDEKDHGKKVHLYNLVTGEVKTVFSADPEFGIDDIVVSGDKQRLAVWEVKFVQDSRILEGGNSRVYTISLSNPANKTLIADEQNVSSTNPLRYPLFFDSLGRLFLDTFGPNGGGWNLGLWVTAADGSDLSSVPGMADGDYSIDPIPSPDGTKIAFTGYDSSAFPQLQTASTSGVLRPAIANPNLLQIMDLVTFEKITLLGSDYGAQYANPVWSDDQGKIAFLKYKVLDSETSQYQGLYVYDLLAGETTQIFTPEENQPVTILKFDQKNLYWGKESQNMGNLGNNYQSAFESFSFTNLLDSTANPIVTGLSLQFIDCLNKAPGTPLAINVSSQTPEPTSFSLKLKSFEMKPIAQVRSPQQNEKEGTPRCRDLLGLEKRSEWAAARREGKCSDSPLYLYPEKETWVSVKVHSPAQILYSDPLYNDGWQVLARPNGQLSTADGETLNKISYNYYTPLNTLNSPKSPTNGLVVKREELKETLEVYAKNLGLAGGEIVDFVSFWSESLPASPFYFISHFKKSESQKMMPLEITPQPNTLIQVVMYFKPLEKVVEVPPPLFEKLPSRAGFVAVDWSGIADY